MKIHVPSIPESGQSFEFDQNTPWFLEILRTNLRELLTPSSLATGKIDFLRTNQNLTSSGSLNLMLTPICSRCGQHFQMPLVISIQRHLVPFFGQPHEGNLSAEEEVELNAEDLEFSFYHNEEINLAEIVAEEIQLALPMRFLCNEFCRGLCPHCGTNLNETNCRCDENLERSPFSVLKNFKLRP